MYGEYSDKAVRDEDKKKQHGKKTQLKTTKKPKNFTPSLLPLKTYGLRHCTDTVGWPM